MYHVVRSNSTKITKLTAVIFFIAAILFVFVNCSSDKPQKSTITYTAAVRDHKVTINADGILEAHSSVEVRIGTSLGLLQKITYLIPEGSEVKKGDIIIRLQDAQLEHKYKEALNEIEIMKADAKKRETQLNDDKSKMESQLKTLVKSAEAIKLRQKEIAFLPPVKQKIEELKIQKFELEAEETRRKIRSLEKVKEEEKKSLEMKIVEMENDMSMYTNFMNRLEIKSPLDGIVIYAKNGLTNRKVQEGDDIQRWNPIVEIPDMSKMLVRIQVDETIAQKMKMGQKANITVSSAGDFTLTGKVTIIDKVAKRVRGADNNLTQIKMVGAVVEIDSTRAELTPGLTAKCSIVIEEIENSVIIPLESVFGSDSLKCVYIFDGNRYERRNIVFAFRGNDYMAIKEGLKGGEKLALIEPDISLVK